MTVKGVASGTDGAVAQLGERRNGIAKVRGSIPLGSTNPLLTEYKKPGRDVSLPGLFIGSSGSIGSIVLIPDSC